MCIKKENRFNFDFILTLKLPSSKFRPQTRDKIMSGNMGTASYNVHSEKSWPWYFLLCPTEGRVTDQHPPDVIQPS